MENKEARRFSDADSAYLFYSEYAQCQLTGKNLWKVPHKGPQNPDRCTKDIQ